MTKFEAPGPGMWRRDESRISGAITPYLNELVTENMKKGLAASWKHYGAPLERMDIAFVAGRPYFRIRPIGAPDEPRGTPPRLVFKMLFWLHPELRRRKKRAKEVFAKKIWREDAARWRDETEPAYRARNLAFQEVNPEDLDDADLASHLRELNASCREAFVHHFKHGSAHIIPVGDFLVRTSEWTGKSVADCAVALRGSSPASSEPLDLIDAVAEALRADDAARAELDGTDEPASRVKRLREHDGDVGRTLRAYLSEHGNRIITGSTSPITASSSSPRSF